MKADWARVNELFHQALARPASERVAFLRAECGADERLRQEVASLLEASEQAGTFMETSALDALSSAETVHADPLMPAGTRVGHYRVLDVIGEGGMGVVYLAEDTRLGRPVALKAVAPRRAGSVDAARERLMQEARMAAGLQHGGIATVYALEEIDGQLYIATEYIPGETLRQELQRGPLTPAQLLDTALQLARALQRAHELGVVHRDLKPENVIRTPTGVVKILDFGLARYRELIDTPPAADAAAAGTPAYMSPEQIRGENVGFRSDLFSLGIMLYELLTGTHPFAAASDASILEGILDREPERIDPGSDRIAARLASIIVTCLQKVPAARFSTTSELVVALERVRADEPGQIAAANGFGAGTGTGAARWWWRFHQIATPCVYVLLLVPVWSVHRISGQQAALWLFFGAVAAVAVASTLRLNLVFAARSLPAHVNAQRQAAHRWIVRADVLFAATLLGGFVLTIGAATLLAALLLIAAVATFLSALVIEPATTRAAFDGP